MIAIIIYTSYGDYEKIASGYIAAYSHRHFADAPRQLASIAQHHAGGVGGGMEG